MSIQITTGVNSLVAIGFGIADISTLVNLARHVGNWFSASSRDAEFLAVSDLDEMTILTRKGSVNMKRFNKRWGQRLRILMKSQAHTIEGPIAEEALGEMSKFTAYMTCIVAVLDELSSNKATKLTVKLLLMWLLKLSQRGKDFLDAEYNNHLNSWRSNASARGLNLECSNTRLELVENKILPTSYMPPTKSETMAKALYWLLAEKSESYITPSSDVIGAMICLKRLGFDIISCEGPGLPEPLERPCRIVYSPYAIVGTGDEKFRKRVTSILTRAPSTAVSLEKPHESLTTYPIDGSTAERCRVAWKRGINSAAFLRVEVDIPTSKGIANAQDFHYTFTNCGRETERTAEGVFQLVFAHALVVNQETCQNLENVLTTENEDILNWIHGQTTDPISTSPHVRQWNRLNEDFKKKINAFTVFQAFFMGYYYAVFLSLVDTSTLEIQTVDGRWGYCSAEFLQEMRGYCRKSAEKGMSRQEVIQILAQLLFSHKVMVPNPAREQWCLGVVDKRTLLAQSLLGNCRTPQDIGRFVLLDVDVGGIPTVRGLVMPGVTQPLKREIPKEHVKHDVQEQGPEKDFTIHIEADWDGDPNNMLLCFRYNGRRVGTVNPSLADLLFCYAYVNPVERYREGAQRTIIPALECNLSDLQEGKVLFGGGGENIVLVQVYGRPHMRYAAVAFYGKTFLPGITMASNCINTAIKRARTIEKTGGIVLAGEGPWEKTQPPNRGLRHLFVEKKADYGMETDELREL